MPKTEWVSGPRRRYVVSPEDVDQLEQKTLSFTNTSREDAEDKAYSDYRRTHHVKGAAHHLQGMRAAQAIGELSQAKRHKLIYNMHLKALGMQDDGKVPGDIENALGDPGREPGYRYRPHKADAFLLNKNEEGEYTVLSKSSGKCPKCGSHETDTLDGWKDSAEGPRVREEHQGKHTHLCMDCGHGFNPLKSVQGGGENPGESKANLRVVKNEVAYKALKSLVKAAMKFKKGLPDEEGLDYDAPSGPVADEPPGFEPKTHAAERGEAMRANRNNPENYDPPEMFEQPEIEKHRQKVLSVWGSALCPGTGRNPNCTGYQSKPGEMCEGCGGGVPIIDERGLVQSVLHKGEKKPYMGRDEGIRRSKLPPGAPGADKSGVGVQTDKKKEEAKTAARKWKPGNE